MTSKERVRAALRGEPVDHVPFSPFLAYVWDFFPKNVQKQGKLAFHHRVGADPLWRGAPCPVRPIVPDGLEFRNREEGGRTIMDIVTPVGNLRQAWGRSDSAKTSFLMEHALKTEEDYKIQMWIEEHTRHVYDRRFMDEHFAADGREGLSLGMLVPRLKSAFQCLVEHMAGTEELAYALADFPDTVEALWRAMVKNDLDAVALAVESEYEYFITWEDSSTQNYSPDQYDKYIGSEIGEWCRILAASERRYVQHACGHVRELVGRMQAHGVDAVESLSPPPTGNLSVRDARKVLGSRTGIIGGIEPTQFLQLPLEKLGAYVESVIADAAGGLLVLANSDSCPPGVTVEKFKLVAEVAARSHG